MLKQKNITLFDCKELHATICCRSWRLFVTVRDYSKFSQTSAETMRLKVIRYYYKLFRGIGDKI